MTIRNTELYGSFSNLKNKKFALIKSDYIQTDWFENKGFLQTDWFEAILDNDMRDFLQKDWSYNLIRFMVQFQGLAVQNVFLKGLKLIKMHQKTQISEVRMISNSKTMNQVRHAPNLDMFCGGIKKD